MAMKLARELERLQIDLSPDDFRDSLVELFQAMFPTWAAGPEDPIETLLRHWRDAGQFCRAACKKYGIRHESENDAFILGAILNIRKASRLGPPIELEA